MWEWVETIGNEKPLPRKRFKGEETHGLMLRFDEGQYAMRSHRKIQPEVVSAAADCQYPFCRKPHRADGAYDSHNPSNRIYNNILQIARHPDAQGMDGEESGNLRLLNEKLLEYASSLIHFGICYGSIDQDLQTLSQLCL